MSLANAFKMEAPCCSRHDCDVMKIQLCDFVVDDDFQGEIKGKSCTKSSTHKMQLNLHLPCLTE